MRTRVRRLRLKVGTEITYWRHAPFCPECRPDRLAPYIVLWVIVMCTLVLVGSTK